VDDHRLSGLLLVVLVYAATFRLVTLQCPFDYGDEATGSFYGIMARNYLRFPWAETHGMPIVSVGSKPGVRPVLYTDHSPLVPLLIAPVYRAFGFGEWQTRLPTATATLVSVFTLFVLVRRFGTPRAALMAAALFAAMPMTLYFGGQPEVTGMPLVLGALVTVFAYLTFHTTRCARFFAVFLAAFTLVGVSDWPGFVLVPVLVSHFVITQPRRCWPWMIAFSCYSATVFALLYGYIAWAGALSWTWMIPLVKGRAALGRAVHAGAVAACRVDLQRASPFASLDRRDRDLDRRACGGAPPAARRAGGRPAARLGGPARGDRPTGRVQPRVVVVAGDAGHRRGVRAVGGRWARGARTARSTALARPGDGGRHRGVCELDDQIGVRRTLSWAAGWPIHGARVGAGHSDRRPRSE
jgi:hypothetical protein